MSHDVLVVDDEENRRQQATLTYSDNGSEGLLHLVVEKDRPAGVVIQRTGDLCAAFFKVEAY